MANPSESEKEFFHEFMAGVRSFRNTRTLTDFELISEEHRFPVHRLILAASCPNFKDYFLKTQSKEMIINCIQPKVLQIIVDYFYSGQLIMKEEQSPEFLKKLFEASEFFQIRYLCNSSLKLILDKAPDNVCQSHWKVIEELNKATQMQSFFREILQQFPTFIQSDIFLQCSFNQVDFLLFGLENADEDQRIILQCILNWIRHDLNDRQQHLSRFLRKVKFDEMGVELFNFKDEDLLKKNMIFLDAYRQFLFNKEAPNEDANNYLFGWVVVKMEDIVEEEQQEQQRSEPNSNDSCHALNFKAKIRHQFRKIFHKS